MKGGGDMDIYVDVPHNFFKKMFGMRAVCAYSPYNKIQNIKIKKFQVLCFLKFESDFSESLHHYTKFS